MMNNINHYVPLNYEKRGEQKEKNLESLKVKLLRLSKEKRELILRRLGLKELKNLSSYGIAEMERLIERETI